jgi:arylsulfatase A-like enzyme
VAGNHVNYPLHQRTYYSVLRDRGYSVGGVGKFDLHKAAAWWGLNGWIEDLATLGFTHAVDNAGKWDAVNSGAECPRDPYMRYLHEKDLAHVHVLDMNGRRGSRRNRANTAPTPLPEDAYCDNWVTENGLSMLGGFPAGRPWHLVVNFVGPHDPWDVTERMRRGWEGAVLPPPVGSDGEPAREAVDIRRNYAASLENIDRNIGRLIDAVADRGELHDTVVVYSSDHGEMLGDFGRYGKSDPHQGSVRIPLVLCGPGIRKAAVSDALVELQDLTATFVQMAGCRMEEARDSLSLAPLLEGRAGEHRQYAVSALSDPGHDWRMIMDDRFKLVVAEEGGMFLYDLREDPWETRPRVCGPSEGGVVRKLLDLLESVG